MADVRVFVVGRVDPFEFTNAKYVIDQDRDLHVYRGRGTDTGTTLGYFAAGQWQYVERLK